MKHYTEVELLETHYLKPCMSTDVLAHLDSCAECAERYARLEEKLRGGTIDPTDKPETFWARQKLSILRRAQQRNEASLLGRAARVAAAAVLAFSLGGLVVYEAVKPRLNEPVKTVTSSSTIAAETTKSKTEDATAVRDPWQSEELSDFHSMVSWESWGEPNNGGQS